MPFDPEDPRLTAYALGELDEADRSAVEAILADSPEARQALEEIQATSRLLVDQLGAESIPALSLEQRLTIEDQLRPRANPNPNFIGKTQKPGNGRPRRIFLAAAAGLILTLGGFGLGRITFDPQAVEPRQLALLNRDQPFSTESQASTADRAPAPSASSRPSEPASEALLVESALPEGASETLPPPPSLFLAPEADSGVDFDFSIAARPDQDGFRFGGGAR